MIKSFLHASVIRLHLNWLFNPRSNLLSQGVSVGALQTQNLSFKEKSSPESQVAAGATGQALNHWAECSLKCRESLLVVKRPEGRRTQVGEDHWGRGGGGGGGWVCGWDPGVVFIHFPS